MGEPPTPPYTEATGPQAEAKLSTNDLPAEVLEEAILAAARAYCREQYDYSGPYTSPTGGEEHLERDARTFVQEKVFRTWVQAAGEVIFAAGRAQAAADIRERTLLMCMDGVGRHLVAECARIAESSTQRDDEARTDADEVTLPASSGGQIHGETPTGGHLG